MVGCGWMGFYLDRARRERRIRPAEGARATYPRPQGGGGGVQRLEAARAKRVGWGVADGKMEGGVVCTSPERWDF